MVLRYVVLLWVLFSLSNGVCLTLDPRFAQYPAPYSTSTKAARVKIINKQDHEYHSALEAADLRHPNFAGHYVMTEIGCGTMCVMAAAIDTLDGHVSWLPFTVSGASNAPLNWEPLIYRAESVLLIVDGARDERRFGRYFYVFRNGRFQQIADR